jgi:uroporphyrinogen decarboxylase
LKMFDRQLLPHYQRACSETKEYFLQKNPNGKIQFHSCGAIPTSFMEGLLRGKTSGGLQCVDGFDPVQPKAARHSGHRSKKLFVGDRMFFYGGIDVQETLPWGTEEDVRKEVRQRIWELGQGGGYVLSSSHRLEHDVPIENTLAMIDEAHKYGVYPLPKEPPEGADPGEDLLEMQR